MLGERAPVVVDGPHDSRVSALAAAQRQQMSRAQLLAAGLSDSAIRRRLRSGMLIERHRCVYSLGDPAGLPLAEETAALLAAGERSALSHHTAAVLAELRAGVARPIHVTVVATARCGRLDGVVVHSSRTLLRRDVTIVAGLPVTSGARTLLDISATPGIDDGTVEGALRQAFVHDVVTPAALADVLARAGSHRGRARLTRLVDSYLDDGSELTDTEWERRLLELIRLAGLPAPLIQRHVGRSRPDLVWPDLQIIVEADGYQVHGTRHRFEADRRRDAPLQARGWMVLRFTNRQIRDEPFWVIATIAAAIAHRSPATAR